VHTARDGQEALLRLPELSPDVVTLDVNMPGMDGLACLRRIMEQFPRPVLMVSSLTQRGAWQTLEALRLGAVDYIPKPHSTGALIDPQWAAELVEKVRAAHRARIRARRPPGLGRESGRGASEPPEGAGGVSAAAAVPGLVLVGASTGGPGALEELLARLPANFPLPVLVAQHMPPGFTQVFAQRLARHVPLAVQEVNGPTPLRAGLVVIARGGADVVVSGQRGGPAVAQDVEIDPGLRWHPSVERMVRSAMEVFPPQHLLAVQLTGMGSDGADAMAELRRRGGWTVAESEESAVIFGMPKELIERGGASAVLPLERIPAALVEQAARVAGAKAQPVGQD
ncbi:MAG TPA: chemotaxis-specific protein-glutamate methyltransferase CheB, partial [Limnochordales bacterium]